MGHAELAIHHWDWHFNEPNPYFRRLPHRPRKLMARIYTGAHFLSDSRLDYRVARSALRVAGRVRRIGRALLASPR